MEILARTEGLADVLSPTAIEVCLRFGKVGLVATHYACAKTVQIDAFLECVALEEHLVLEHGHDAHVLGVRKEGARQLHDVVVGPN